MEQLPNPAKEAGDTAVQIATLVSVAAELVARRRAQKAAEQAAEQEHLTATERAQRQAEYNEARTRWEPANDDRWLRHAGTIDVAKAWGAAVVYADHDQHAATAIERCEARLSDLHPHAMGRYDRLRTEDGLDRVEAMGRVAPLFAEPEPHVGQAGPQRLELASAATDDLADQSLSDRERAAAAADLATPDLVSTPKVDEHTIGETHAARHTSIADAATAQAMASRSPAQVAAAAYPQPISTALKTTHPPRSHAHVEPARLRRKTTSSIR